jgi:hypothetical protein
VFNYLLYVIKLTFYLLTEVINVMLNLTFRAYIFHLRVVGLHDSYCLLFERFGIHLLIRLLNFKYVFDKQNTYNFSWKKNVAHYGYGH